MKKATLLLSATLAFSMSYGQLPVSTTPGKKQALIEVYTGNKCGVCPTGHMTADNAMNANQGKVFSIDYHADLGPTSLTYPSTQSNGKDLRVTDSYDVLVIPGVIGNGSSIGLPAGMVNRMTPISPATPQNSGGMLMSYNHWTGMATTVINQNTYVNIAGQAYVHPTTRQMYVYMEAYYTSNGPSTPNRISVALVQDNILAYQTSGSSYPAMWSSPNYKHNHALRDFINTGSPNSARGETMTGANTTGTKWSKTFTYTVPAQYGLLSGKEVPAVLSDLSIIAFISETDKNIVAVCKVPITITTSADIFAQTSPSNEIVNSVSVYPSPMMNEGNVVFTLNQSANVTIEMVNALGQVVMSDNLKTLDMGEHKYELNSSNLTNGIYFVNIKVGEGIITKKISVLK